MSNDLSIKMTLDDSDFKQKINEAKQATEAFENEAKQASEQMKNMSDSTKKSGNFMREYKREIKELKSQLLQLEEGTEEYTQAIQRLADQQFKLRDINETARLSANDLGERFALMTNTLGGMTNVVGGVNGAMNLFGVESEEVNQAMVKMQAVIAVVNGLEGLEGLSKTLPICANMFKDLTGTIKTCIGTLMKNPWVLLATAILGVVVAVVKATKATKELTEEEKKAEAEAKRLESVNGSVAEAQDTAVKSAGEMWGKYKLLQTQWNLLGDDLNAKKKFIEDNASAFNSLGVEVLTVANIEKIMVDSTGSFCRAMQLRCEAIALQNQIVKEGEKYFVEYNKDPYKATKVKAGDIIGTKESESLGIPVWEMNGSPDADGYGYGDQHRLTQAEADIVNASREAEATRKNEERRKELTKTYTATVTKLTGLLQDKVKEQQKNPYGDLSPKKYIPKGTTTTTTKGTTPTTPTTTTTNNTTTTTTSNENTVDLLTVLKEGIKNGNSDVFANYNEEYIKNNPSVEKGSQKYWEDLTSALTTLKNNSADEQLNGTIQTLIEALPTYEAPEEQAPEVNLIQVAEDAVNSGDFTTLDQYIATSTQAKQGSVKFLESKISALENIESNTDDIELIEKVDTEVDRLKKELETLKQQIRTKTDPEGVKIETQQNFYKQGTQQINDLKQATSGVAQIFSSIASMTDDATGAWLNYASGIISTAGQLINTLQAISLAQAISGATSLGPLGIIQIAVSTAAVLAAFAKIPKFKDGGIVGGNNYNDGVHCMLSSGEMVLNKAQQGNLFKLINNGTTPSSYNGGEVQFKISGKNLIGVLYNYNNKINKVL